MADSGDERWLLLIHQIPPRPNYLRVKIGRRLQRLGAVPIKNSVYVLPRADQSQEDLQWVVREIVEGGGDATVCEARFIDGLSNAQVEALFHAARDAEYAAVAGEARELARALSAAAPTDDRHTEAAAQLARVRRRMGEIASIDFFGAVGRETADGLLRAIEGRLYAAAPAEHAAPAGAPRRADLAGGRTWVTRRGIHVDRMASAWLIRRSIDPAARFKFVPSKGYRPEPGELRFDMFEAEFTHVGDRCTFEVLREHFELHDLALQPIAEIVHDIDLKDAKFGREETAGIDRLIAGIAMAHRDDEARLTRGSAVFDDLYEYFKRKRR